MYLSTAHDENNGRQWSSNRTTTKRFPRTFGLCSIISSTSDTVMLYKNSSHSPISIGRKPLTRISRIIWRCGTSQNCRATARQKHQFNDQLKADSRMCCSPDLPPRWSPLLKLNILFSDTNIDQLITPLIVLFIFYSTSFFSIVVDINELSLIQSQLLLVKTTFCSCGSKKENNPGPAYEKDLKEKSRCVIIRASNHYAYTTVDLTAASWICLTGTHTDWTVQTQNHHLFNRNLSFSTSTWKHHELDPCAFNDSLMRSSSYRPSMDLLSLPGLSVREAVITFRTGIHLASTVLAPPRELTDAVLTKLSRSSQTVAAWSATLLVLLATVSVWFSSVLVLFSLLRHHWYLLLAYPLVHPLPPLALLGNLRWQLIPPLHGAPRQLYIHIWLPILQINYGTQGPLAICNIRVHTLLYMTYSFDFGFCVSLLGSQVTLQLDGRQVFMPCVLRKPPEIQATTRCRWICGLCKTSDAIKLPAMLLFTGRSIGQHVSRVLVAFITCQFDQLCHHYATGGKVRMNISKRIQSCSNIFVNYTYYHQGKPKLNTRKKSLMEYKFSSVYIRSRTIQLLSPTTLPLVRWEEKEQMRKIDSRPAFFCLHRIDTRKNVVWKSVPRCISKILYLGPNGQSALALKSRHSASIRPYERWKTLKILLHCMVQQ